MSLIVLVRCPRCTEKFSQLSDEPMALSCGHCGHEFDGFEYARLRDQAYLLVRELEQGVRV